MACSFARSLPRPVSRCSRLARYVNNHVRVYFGTIMVETLIATVMLENVVWRHLKRVVVWPPAMIMCATLGDVIAHYMSVRVAHGTGVCCLCVACGCVLGAMRSSTRVESRDPLL
jgi:sorbitol-specific phosphotransferase system component IIBC